MKRTLVLGCLMVAMAFGQTACGGCNEKGTAKEGAKAKAAAAGDKAKAAEAKKKETVSLPDTPEGTVEAVLKALDEQHPQVVWEALPGSYQKDVNKLVREFAAKMDKDLWNKAFSLVAKFAEVAAAKRDFFFGNQMIKQQIAVQGKDKIEQAFDGAVEVIRVLATGQLSKQENLVAFDGAKVIDAMVNEFKAIDKAKLKKIEELMKAYAPDDTPKSFKNAKIEKVKADDKTATIKVTDEAGKAEEIELVKVEDRWVPKEMAQEWKSTIDETMKGISEMSGEEMTKQKPQMLAMAAAVMSGLEQLGAAKTQAEFDQVLAGLLKSF